MRQGLPRIPKDRIAVLIGSKGTTAKSLRNASGAKEFHIDSETGDVEVVSISSSRRLFPPPVLLQS